MLVATVLVGLLRVRRNILSTTATVMTEIKVRAKKRTWKASLSLIHDETLNWDPYVQRLWLDEDRRQTRPPGMILLTNYAWNQPNQTQGMKISRGIRETELLTGVINHPWFHPTLWEDWLTGKVTEKDFPANTRFYVFSDIDQCMDSNYPTYGGGNEKNLDGSHNRSVVYRSTREIYSVSRVQMHVRRFNEALNSTVMTEIHFNCGGWGIPGTSDEFNRKNGTSSGWDHLSIASLSSLISVVHEGRDQGLPPPAPKPALLTPSQLQDVETCEAEIKRRFYVTYAGNLRSGRNEVFHQRFGGARGSYLPLNDNQRIFVARPHITTEFSKSVMSNYSYEDMLRQTVFALAPRGDNKFSYRFTEIMSAGAIPVVHADDWVWPFRPELVDWTKCAVNLPEKDAGRTTTDYLDAISVEQRCLMRKECLRIYQTYMATPVKIIDGLVQGLELVAQRIDKPLPLSGVRCDTFTDPEECNLQR